MVLKLETWNTVSTKLGVLIVNSLVGRNYCYCMRLRANCFRVEEINSELVLKLETWNTKLGVLIVNRLVGEKIIATACAYGPTVFELRK